MQHLNPTYQFPCVTVAITTRASGVESENYLLFSCRVVVIMLSRLLRICLPIIVAVASDGVSRQIPTK